MAGDRADEEYFQAIESRFAQLRGRPLLLSTRDVALVDEWWRAGIPLRVVLTALETVFQRRAESGEGRPVLSLAYCRHAVDAAFESWTESRLGAQDEQAEALPIPHDAADTLDRKAAELRRHRATAVRAAGEEVARLADRLRGSPPPSLATVEKELTELEDRVVDELLAAIPAAERHEMERAVAEDLAPLRPRLTRRAYETSRLGQLRAAVRDREQLPRLTLYDL